MVDENPNGVEGVYTPEYIDALIADPGPPPADLDLSDSGVEIGWDRSVFWRRDVHHVLWHNDGQDDIVLQVGPEMYEALVGEIEDGASGIFMEM